VIHRCRENFAFANERIMGISPFVCVVCSKTGRCARFDGTAPYSPQDSSTPAARRCKPTCRGEQFCFESTTVFIPKKLVSVAPGVKIPLKVKSGLMCVYDGSFSSGFHLRFSDRLLTL